MHTWDTLPYLYCNFRGSYRRSRSHLNTYQPSKIKTATAVVVGQRCFKRYNERLLGNVVAVALQQPSKAH